jgi:sulfopyruvate decarboxylase subunit beta
MKRDDVLRALAGRRRQSVVVTTMGTVRPWARLSDHRLDFASADSAMGHAADFALGIALAQPQRKVVCLNGDGSMLMSLGTLVTIVASGATNFVLFVLQNDTYELTGNQAIPGAGRVDFAGMARAAGPLRTSRPCRPFSKAWVPSASLSASSAARRGRSDEDPVRPRPTCVRL